MNNDLIRRKNSEIVHYPHFFEWFLECLDRAISGAEQILARIFHKDHS